MKVEQITNTDLGNKIIELRKLGLTYSCIVTQLGCSKSTVSYYCSNTTKIKNKEKVIRYANEFPTEFKFIKHLDNFKRRIKGSGKNFNID